MLLEGKVILVTGVAKGGIGEAVVQYYSAHNQIIVNSRTMVDGRIADAHLAIAADCTTTEGVNKLEQEVRKQFGTIDVLVNCVGGSLGSYPFQDLTSHFVEQVFRVNLTSSLLLSQMADRLMAGGGSICHIVSSSAFEPEVTKLPYAMAKAGQVHLIRSLAKILAPKNIIVNGVSPTYVFTDRHLDELQKEADEKGTTVDEAHHDQTKKQLIQEKLFPADLLPFIDLALSTRFMTGKVIHATAGRVL